MWAPVLRRTGIPVGLMCALVLGGCAATQAPAPSHAPLQFEIAGVEIRNELDYRVTDVQVMVAATGSFVSCGSVFPDTSCATSFALREYRGEALSVTWKEHGAAQSEDDFVLRTPAGLDTSRPVWIQVVIFAPGDAGARVMSAGPSEP